MILRADGFDKAIVGYSEELHRLVYSVTKCIDILIYNGMSSDEAEEYFWYNVAGSYVGDLTPIWCNDIF